MHNFFYVVNQQSLLQNDVFYCNRESVICNADKKNPGRPATSLFTRQLFPITDKTPDFGILYSIKKILKELSVLISPMVIVVLQ